MLPLLVPQPSRPTPLLRYSVTDAPPPPAHSGGRNLESQISSLESRIPLAHVMSRFLRLWLQQLSSHNNNKRENRTLGCLVVGDPSNQIRAAFPHRESADADAQLESQNEIHSAQSNRDRASLFFK